MRDRFVKSPDSLSNHELLELALFYAVPRVNVNPLAHTLINKYGSLSAVIHTPAEDLKQIDGVGDSVAAYLNMLGKISDTAQEEKFNNLKFYNYAEVKNYVVKHYSYYQSEVFTVFLLDAKARIIGRESFTQNRAFYHDRLQQETNPEIRRLLEQDRQHLDEMQVEMKLAREFYLVVRLKDEKR